MLYLDFGALELLGAWEGAPLPPHGWACSQRPQFTFSKGAEYNIDNILGSIQRGVTFRSRLATFCEHYSFISCLEPLKVDEVLGDPDWVMAMQKELNNFTRNEV